MKKLLRSSLLALLCAALPLAAQNRVQDKPTATSPAGDDWLLLQGDTNAMRKLSPGYYASLAALNSYFANPTANGSFSASTWRTGLGGTTVGVGFFTLANPSAVRFPRVNADNTVSLLDAPSFLSAIGAGTSSFDGSYSSLTDVPSTFAPSAHTHAGEDIASGTIADARIAASIARDSEVSDAISALSSVYQPLSAKLTAWSGGDTPSSFTLGLVDATDAAAWRSALGAGTSSFDGSYSSLTDVPSTFAPSAHASTHLTGGTDAIPLAVAGGDDGLMSGADKAKLDGIAAGATANSPDATLLDRANHTGTQAISTITGLQAALDGKVTLGAATSSGLTMSTAQLLGRTTTGTGAIEEISIGSGLSLSSGVLSNAAVVSSANPTASVGLTAVNGSASTYMRSDAAPALNQSITPVWTAVHRFAAGLRIGSGSATSGWIIAGSPLAVQAAEGASGNGDILALFASNTSFARTALLMRKSRNELANPSAVANGDMVGSVLGSAYDGNNFYNNASIDFEVDDAVSTATVPIAIRFRSGKTSRSDAVSIDSDRRLIAHAAVRFASFGAGTLQTDSSGNVTTSSDERLKDLAGDYTRGLAEIRRLRPKLWHWKAGSGLSPDDIHAGATAQDLLAAGLTEAVFTHRTAVDTEQIEEQVEESFKEGQRVEKKLIKRTIERPKRDAAGSLVTKRVPLDYYTVDQTPVIYALVNAVKELADRCDAQAAQIAALEARLAALENPPKTK